MVNKLKSEDLTSNQESAGVAYVLLNLGLKNVDETAPPNARSILPQQDTRALMEMAATAALRTSPNQQMYLQTLQPMLPEMEKFVPALAPRLRRQMATLDENAGKGESNAMNSTAEPDAPRAPANERLRTAEERAAQVVVRAREAGDKGETARALELLMKRASL